MPTEIDVIERQIMQHEMERQALKKEKDPASKERLKKLEKELAELKEKSSALKAEWQKEKALLDEQRKLKEQLDALRTELERAQRRGELAKASEIQYGQIPEVERKLAEFAAKTSESKNQLLREEVTEEDIAEVVSSWTGIPVSRLQEGEREKLLKLEEHLHQRVVGQEKRSKPSPTRCGARGPVCRMKIARSVHSFFSDPLALAKRNCRARSQNFCSMTSTP